MANLIAEILLAVQDFPFNPPEEDWSVWVGQRPEGVLLLWLN